jgi:hypothetical protein
LGNSIPYVKIGSTVWSNTCNRVLIFGLCPSKHLYILNKAFKPLLYNSSLDGIEVWGTFDSQKLLDKGDNYFSKLCNDLKAEKAHMKFCKFSLGVGKRSSNLAVIGELGRYPLIMARTINMHTDLQISSCWEHIST